MDGQRIDQMSARSLARWRAERVGFVFQLYNLPPMLPAETQRRTALLLTRLTKPERRRRVQTALSLVGRLCPELGERAGTRLPAQLRLSRIGPPARLKDMGRQKTLRALTAVVVLHLAVAIAHGSAHASAGVDLGAAAIAFVLVIIMAGPPAGLVWMRADWRAGASLVAVTMTAALLFGVVNHFVIPGADHVAHVAASSRLWFGTTAALLMVTEAAGAILAAACGWRPIGRIA